MSFCLCQQSSIKCIAGLHVTLRNDSHRKVVCNSPKKKKENMKQSGKELGSSNYSNEETGRWDIFYRTKYTNYPIPVTP